MSLPAKLQTPEATTRSHQPKVAQAEGRHTGDIYSFLCLFMRHVPLLPLQPTAHDFPGGHWSGDKGKFFGDSIFPIDCDPSVNHSLLLNSAPPRGQTSPHLIPTLISAFPPSLELQNLCGLDALDVQTLGLWWRHSSAIYGTFLFPFQRVPLI